MRATDPNAAWLRDRLAILRRNVDPAWHARIDGARGSLYVDAPMIPPSPTPAPRAPAPPRLVSSFEPTRVRVSVHVPAWISVGSALAGTLLVLSIVLYWIL